MRYLIIFMFIPFAYNIQAQIAKAESDENKIFSFYLEQYLGQVESLYKSRNMSDIEFDKYANKDKILSLKNFITISKRLFPYKEKVGILLFFHNNDTLTRVFLEPGALIEVKSIPVTKNDIEKLSKNIYSSMGIYQLSKARSPIQRGISVVADDKKATEENVVSFEKAIANATKILLPDHFSPEYKHLVILPTLNIGTFPFHLLKPYQDSLSLIDRCSFTISAGFIDLIAARKKRVGNGWRDSPNDFRFTFDNPLFVCNPYYPTNTNYFFPDLQGAKKEIDSILPFCKNYTLLNKAIATKDTVLTCLRNCDVAYFATHGIANENRVMDSSFLVLSGGPSPFLTAQDIMNMRDSTFSNTLKFPQMVILSACQTGLGKSMEAGVAGLARSFLIAGATQVIMSLWNVDDDATSYLMNRFVYYLQQPNTFCPSEPLRLAQLDTRKKYPNPSKWASFSVFGVDY